MDFCGSVDEIFPTDRERATFLGTVYDSDEGGPSIVGLRHDIVADITHVEPTMSALLERADVADVASDAAPRKTWDQAEVLTSTLRQDIERPHFLAPVDLQVVKAPGVTFIVSMLERIIEE